MKTIIRNICITLFFVNSYSASYSQIAVSPGFFFAKEYSKEQSLYLAKTFVMNNVIGLDKEKTIKFEIDPLAASNSGELTTLIYKCYEKEMGGIILGFYGTRWTATNGVYQQFAFKNLPKAKAEGFLNKIQEEIDLNHKYLFQNIENANIYFTYDDITILITYSGMSEKIRVYWGDFDSEWNEAAFLLTKKRYEKKSTK